MPTGIPWAALVRFTFLDNTIDPATPARISLAKYLHLLHKNADAVISTDAPLFGFLAVIGAYKSTGKMRQLIGAFALACLLHFVLFPHYEARYLSAAYLVFGAGILANFNAPSDLRPSPVDGRRAFTDQDLPGSAGVAVVNQAFIRRYLANRDFTREMAIRKGIP
jgi:hypothetical protein